MGLNATKPVSQGVWQTEFQTCFFRYRDWLENRNFVASLDMIFSSKGIIAKGLIRVQRCAGWSVLLLF